MTQLRCKGKSVRLGSQMSGLPFLTLCSISQECIWPKEAVCYQQWPKQIGSWFCSHDKNFPGGQFLIGLEAFQCQSYGLVLDIFLVFSSWLQDGWSNSKHIRTAIRGGRRQVGYRKQIVTPCTHSSHQEVNFSQNILSAKIPPCTSLATDGSRLRDELTQINGLLPKTQANWDAATRKKRGKVNGFGGNKIMSYSPFVPSKPLFPICNKLLPLQFVEDNKLK